MSSGYLYTLKASLIYIVNSRTVRALLLNLIPICHPNTPKSERKELPSSFLCCLWLYCVWLHYTLILQINKENKGKFACFLIHMFIYLRECMYFYKYTLYKYKYTFFFPGINFLILCECQMNVLQFNSVLTLITER